MGSISSFLSRTPARSAASYALSGIGSHAPKTSWSSSASGTNSLMNGARLSVRLPSRMVAICVSDPTGSPVPRRMCSTPAMTVDDTAPSPTIKTPSLPSAGSTPFEIDSMKSLGSRAMPRLWARSISVPCHCAGILPVRAQCCTVLCRLPSSPASADCPPKRSMICFAVLCSVLMAGNLPIKSLVVKPSPLHLQGSTHGRIIAGDSTPKALR